MTPLEFLKSLLSYTHILVFVTLQLYACRAVMFLEGEGGGGGANLHRSASCFLACPYVRRNLSSMCLSGLAL